MNPDLWTALTHIEEIVRLNQPDMQPGLFASLMDTLRAMREIALDADGHLRSEHGCHADCPACQEVEA